MKYKRGSIWCDVKPLQCCRCFMSVDTSFSIGQNVSKTNLLLASAVHTVLGKWKRSYHLRTETWWRGCDDILVHEALVPGFSEQSLSFSDPTMYGDIMFKSYTDMNWCWFTMKLNWQARIRLHAVHSRKLRQGLIDKRIQWFRCH